MYIYIYIYIYGGPRERKSLCNLVPVRRGVAQGSLAQGSPAQGYRHKVLRFTEMWIQHFLMQNRKYRFFHRRLLLK